MDVVSNTSPISNLALIGRLNLLRTQFGRVFIPEAVRLELQGIPDPAACAACGEAIDEGWIACLPVRERKLVAELVAELDSGEAEAIALAVDLQAGLVLIDEKEGRRVARRMDLPVRGLLGVLLLAKASGQVRSVGMEIDALKKKAHFFVDPALQSEVLRAAGED